MVVKILDVQSMDKMGDILAGFYHTKLFDSILDAVWHDESIILRAPDYGAEANMKFDTAP